MGILDVDLLSFEQGSKRNRQAVVEGVMKSLQSGFVYVGHDLAEDLLDEAYGMLQEFFELPQKNKERYTRSGSHGATGYTALMTETAAISDIPDYKEMLNWNTPAPLGHPLRERHPFRYGHPVLPEGDIRGITKLLMTFHESVLDVQKRVLRIIGAGLGVHSDYFDTMLENGATLNRAIHYPAMDMAPDSNYVWAGEHADINLITMLPRATAPGLQVKMDDGSWIDAIPPSGHAILNTGIMLEHLTNGMIPSGVHRVVAEPGQQGDRYSVVQFAHPTPWTMLSPIPTCITEDYPLKFPTISADDALAKVLWEINLIEDGRRIK